MGTSEEKREICMAIHFEREQYAALRQTYRKWWAGELDRPIVPVLTFVVYFGSMKLSKKFMYQPTPAGDDRQVACSNTMMDVTMPAMSTFFTFMVPALVGVYWMFRSLVGILKQFIMSRVMPMPVFTEEDRLEYISILEKNAKIL